MKKNETIEIEYLDGQKVIFIKHNDSWICHIDYLPVLSKSFSVVFNVMIDKPNYIKLKTIDNEDIEKFVRLFNFAKLIGEK